MSIRGLLDPWVPRLGAMGILAVISAASAVVLVHSGAMPMLGLVAVGSGSTGALLAIPLLIWPADRQLAATVNDLSVRLGAAELELAAAARRTSTAAEHHHAAQAARREEEKERADLANELLHCGWEDMAGVEFEEFLAAVFERLAFRVEMTKASGDQGVDLILEKDGRRLAVQAKGYPSGSTIGNKAVQEVHAGMTHYACDSSLVVTNST